MRLRAPLSFGSLIFIPQEPQPDRRAPLRSHLAAVSFYDQKAAYVLSTDGATAVHLNRSRGLTSGLLSGSIAILDCTKTQMFGLVGALTLRNEA
jgi:hypothetical protein